METKNKQELPFSWQFAAGAIAGVSEICLMYPLDVVKTRLQLQVSGATSIGGEPYTSIYDCFRKIIANEGFGRLYRGIFAPVLVEAPKRAIKFAANEQYSQLYKKILGYSETTQLLSILTGVSAGVTEAFVVVPFELVKIRMQDKSNAQLYSSTAQCARSIFRNEGPLALYKGLEPTVLRHAAWNGGYFGVIHYVRGNKLLKEMAPDKMASDFLAGTIGGIFGTLLNTPFDVVKTRIQGSVSTTSSKYVWTFPSVIKIAHEEGYSTLQQLFRLRALYKGFTPKVIRLGPGGGVLLTVFEFITHRMKRFRDRHSF